MLIAKVSYVVTPVWNLEDESTVSHFLVAEWGECSKQAPGAVDVKRGEKKSPSS